jgi:phosphoenolpyruvate carboxykinase (GTP)
MATTAPTTHAALLRWVDEIAKLTKPDKIVWCDGSEAEKKRFTEEAVAAKVLIPLDQKKWPGCYYHHSNQNDVARVEHLTVICTPTREEAGPTNIWMAPAEAYAKLSAIYDGCMKGRTMYVVPYIMGPAA